MPDAVRQFAHRGGGHVHLALALLDEGAVTDSPFVFLQPPSVSVREIADAAFGPKFRAIKSIAGCTFASAPAPTLLMVAAAAPSKAASQKTLVFSILNIVVLDICRQPN